MERVEKSRMLVSWETIVFLLYAAMVGIICNIRRLRLAGQICPSGYLLFSEIVNCAFMGFSLNHES